MLQKNKGSILITTLLVLSIISAVCVSCLGLAYSNSSIFSLEYKTRILKEESLSGIEISRSNIITEVKNAISKSKDREEFNRYFLGNNLDGFCKRITTINISDLNNVYVSVMKNNAYEKDGFINFEVMSKAKDNEYSKSVIVDIKIKNPFKEEKSYEMLENNSKSLESNEFNENSQNSDDPALIKDNKDDNVKIEEELKLEEITNLDPKSLITIENYREM